jgi:hypothetical protein
MEPDHFSGEAFSCFVRIEAAKHFVSFGEYVSQPRRIGRGPGGRNGDAPWMKNEDRYGVYGRFAEYHFPAFARVDDESAEPFPGAGRHAPPFRRAGAALLFTDDIGIFSRHGEDGVFPTVGVKASGFQKGVYGTQRDAMPRSSSVVRIKPLWAWLEDRRSFSS